MLWSVEYHLRYLEAVNQLLMICHLLSSTLAKKFSYMDEL